MRRSLVLLVSDFHAPIDTWTQVLRSLRHHQVVPVVMQDQDATAVAAALGPASTWTMPKAAAAARSSCGHPCSGAWPRRPTCGRRELDAMFEHLGLRPCRLDLPFDPAQLTDYFHRASPWHDVAPADAAGRARWRSRSRPQRPVAASRPSR